jgi:hypothetical protein
MLTYGPAVRLVLWLRTGQCWLADPFSFHSSSEAGGNQAEPVRPPKPQCYCFDAQQSQNDSLDEALGAAFSRGQLIEDFLKHGSVIWRVSWLG